MSHVAGRLNLLNPSPTPVWKNNPPTESKNEVDIADHRRLQVIVEEFRGVPKKNPTTGKYGYDEFTVVAQYNGKSFEIQHTSVVPLKRWGLAPDAVGDPAKRAPHFGTRLWQYTQDASDGKTYKKGQWTW